MTSKLACAGSVLEHQSKGTQSSLMANCGHPCFYWALAVSAGSYRVASCPHNPKVGGSNPSPAIRGRLNSRLFYCAYKQQATSLKTPQRTVILSKFAPDCPNQPGSVEVDLVQSESK